MLRAFWMWDPISSGTYRAILRFSKDDEPYAYLNNKWFFDKSVWQKMLRTMSGCGFNALALANTHPFPFLVDLTRYPEAKVIDDTRLQEYQSMHHWIFETAFDYGLAPYLAFYNLYLPAPLLKVRGIEPEKAAIGSDFSIEYTKHCFRTVLETYPEIVGFIADVGGIEGENVFGRPDLIGTARFVQQAILDTMDAASPEAAIYLRGFAGEPSDLIDKIARRGNRPIHYIASYTHDHLVGAGADASFAKWVEAAEAERVMAEFAPSNFEPWTSFSYDSVEEIIGDLTIASCNGLLLAPLSPFEWPHVSDSCFKYQWQRDLPWYNVWGGSSVARMLHEGQPKWLSRNAKLIPGFSAGSRILELLSLYIAGDRSCGWRPQFCALHDEADAQPHLLSIADLLSMESGESWWEEVTGDRAVHLDEYVKSGTPEDAYGPDELIEELADLSEQAIAAGEKGMRSNSGEKELPSFACDAFCMGKLGAFYVERFRAALAHARSEAPEALEHMSRALGLFKEIQSVDSSHRESCRIRTDHSAAADAWYAVVNALETELADACEGRFERGTAYQLQP
ncbi:MAG: hypothetical protein NT018_02410 [Armatimonadetes bacterium]|nr:hypothetical protein [Armatimonadota bacterium]